MTDTPKNEQKIRVLFAEDAEGTIAIFKEVVKRLGWQGLYAANAVEMMSVVNNLISNKLPLNGVVADINFISGPKLTGITAVREIRKVFPDVPVIFISSYVTSIIREEVRRVNAEIIEKPFNVDTLFLRLSQLIHWSDKVALGDYTGKERRATSLNRTQFSRRASDYVLATPDRIAKTLKDIKVQP